MPTSPTLFQIEEQRRVRIRLTLAAVAYEFYDDPIISDADFDVLAKRVDLNIPTGRDDLDFFFAEEFHTDTGQWVHLHPELENTKARFEQLRCQGVWAV